MAPAPLSEVGGLNEVIDNLPRGSLTVLAGNPGTGKTIFSATFLYDGIVNHGEGGVYVSLAEGRDVFFNNMRGLGLDFERLEREGSLRFLDFVTAREGLTPTIMETVFEEVRRVGAKRLVIDSFSALAQTFRHSHEARIVLHTILSRVARLLGCTTVLVVEVPHGEERIGLGVEEFVADNVILLRRSELDGRVLRHLEVIKMRGMTMPETRAVFTLKGGFRALPPFKVKPVERMRRFEPRPDAGGLFSTGSADLDGILGGGYPRGSTALVEVDERVTPTQYHLITAPTVCNFGAQGRGVIIVSTRGVDHNFIRRRAEEYGFTEDEINKLLRVYVEKYPGFRPTPYAIALEEEVKGQLESYFSVEQELMKSTNQPVLCVAGVDTLIDVYGVRAALSTIGVCATRARETGGLCILLLKPVHPRLAKRLSAIAEVHLRLTQKYGAVLVYGVKPRTCIYALEMDTSRGYAMPKLTPIV